jgi:phosphoribosylformylglycinamidine (FGAM) synthase-like enzyme
VIAVIGDTQGALGASLYLREVLGLEEGDVPDINLETEKNHGDFIRGLITAQSVSAVHDVSDGGLLVAVAEMAMRAGQGASVANASAIAAHGYWFGEDQARYVISFAKDQQAAIEAAAAQANIPFAVIGAVGGKALEVDGESVDVAALCNLNEATIPDLFVA